MTVNGGGRLVLGSGSGIGALLSTSPLVNSGEVSFTAAASIPTAIAPIGDKIENTTTLGDASTLPSSDGGSAVGGTAAAVLEPGIIALLAAGILMLAVARWHRRG